LNGRIIYVSKHRKGAHDQSHWNELDLRSRFIGKNYGIAGDGGFYFNRLKDTVPIIGYTPIKKQKNGSLTSEQKNYNRKLSELRVIIENVNSKFKDWKIFRSGFRHFSATKKNSIDIDLVIQVVGCLTQLLLEESPLRQPWWKPKSHPMSIQNIVNRKNK